MTKEVFELIEELQLKPLANEGGFFRSTYVGPLQNGRPCGTAIYFLATQTDYSKWHKLDCDETYHFYDGSPLQLWTYNNEGIQMHELGANHLYQFTVPAGTWQASCPNGSETYSLVGTSCVPGYQIEGFEMPSVEMVSSWAEKDPINAQIIAQLAGLDK